MEPQVAVDWISAWEAAWRQPARTKFGGRKGSYASIPFGCEEAADSSRAEFRKRLEAE
jgi:hypothetical protein